MINFINMLSKPTRATPEAQMITSHIRRVSQLLQRLVFASDVAMA
jgi:hypothetical protein